MSSQFIRLQSKSLAQAESSKWDRLIHDRFVTNWLVVKHIEAILAMSVGSVINLDVKKHLILRSLVFLSLLRLTY